MESAPTKSTEIEEQPTPKSARRANDLNGSEWTRYSISVWSDITWTKEERALKHPAKFPTMLVKRLIQCFTRAQDKVILDPFSGSGSTLLAAHELGKEGIGFEVYQNYIDLARARLGQPSLFHAKPSDVVMHLADARRMLEFVPRDSVDLCVTSPPYWDILRQKRTADYKETRHYGDQEDDLGTIADYEEFLDLLGDVFSGVYEVLKPGKYCIVNIMDLRKKDKFFPYHIDLSRRITELGFTLDDMIIWDRRKDYNNLRSLGYPYVFRVNKVHEFLLIFQKRN